MFWILLAAGVCLIDLSIKHYIDSRKEMHCSEPILGGRIIITRFHNSGAMLGWLKEKPKMLLGVTLFGTGVVIGGLFGTLRSRKPVLIKLGLSLLAGGAASNTYDRIVRHQVTDYFRIRIGCKRLERIVFNLGDMAIFLGALLALLGEIKQN